MSLAKDYLKSIVGGTVLDVSVGHGTFIEFKVARPSESGIVKLWIYLAKWALLASDKETLASDMTTELFDALIFQSTKLHGSMVKSVYFLDNNEFHIDFTGHYRLEVWADNALYGDNSTLVRLYLDGTHVADFPD